MDILTLFPSLPKRLSGPLVVHYKKIKKNFIDGHYEPTELNGAKFCEVVFRVLQWYVSPNHTYTPLGSSIRNFGQSTRRFENETNICDSIRFHIPRVLNVLYDIRNRRGVGHVGGDVNPNHMDALFVVAAADWVMAELVRIFHQTTTSEAQAAVKSIISRVLPIVWHVAERKRILKWKLPFKEKVLLLLYNEYPKPVKYDKLLDWTEHSNTSIFQKKVLKPLHKEKFIEYHESTKEVYLSPTGLQKVDKILRTNSKR